MTSNPHPFRVHLPPVPSGSAVVFDSPHSGETLPDHFRYACDAQDLMYLHDAHVHKLLAGIPATGSPVLESLIHRSCIDLNRHEHEVDPARIDGEWMLPVKDSFYTKRNAGLFPLFAGPRANRIKTIYNQAASLTVAEGERRIRDYYRPYHARLQDLLTETRQQNAQILHLNMHSFHRDPARPMADIILGDLNGKACDPAISALIKDYFRINEYSAVLNDNYFTGGAIVQRIHAPANGLNSIQIEIARDLYMDQDTLAFLPGKAAGIQNTLNGLGRLLKNYMARRSDAVSAPAPKI